MKAYERGSSAHGLQVYYPIYRGASPHERIGLPLGEHALHASLTLLSLGLWLPIWHYRHKLSTRQI
ncbi:MAG: hypothetical protein ACRC0L_08250 [Angustibacter sp.]